MAKRRGRKAVQRFPGRWKAQSVQVRSKTMHRGFGSPVVRGTEPTKKGDLGPGAAAYRDHIKAGVPGRLKVLPSTELGPDGKPIMKEQFIHVHREPTTTFRLTNWLGNDVPRLEALKRLEYLELTNSDEPGYEDTPIPVNPDAFTKFVKVETKKFRFDRGLQDEILYVNPLEGIRPDHSKALGKYSIVDKYNRIKVTDNPARVIWMYFSSNKYFFVKIERSKIFRTRFYTGRDRALQVIEHYSYAWEEGDVVSLVNERDEG